MKKKSSLIGSAAGSEHLSHLNLLPHVDAASSRVEVTRRTAEQRRHFYFCVSTDV